MAKKKDIDKVIKQPDVLMRAIGALYGWIKKNLKLCIVVASIIVFAVFSIIAYNIYSERKEEKIQLLFTEAMRYYREYSVAGKEESLNKAEEIFKRVSDEAGGNIKALSKLYLGRIYYMKGKIDDSVKSYRDAQNIANIEAIKLLAKKALDVIEKK
ncbi:MAG TPA: tetratricopeptide repeat protein [Syntrophorhabdaceae bacterium]|nr:tetratricopeptide repeat protein [Syntrophorhabdaceae bacterium]HPU28854.1 tetratricopeptide repeat protein [Syntrophorhabdaceae bacterium]